MKATIEFNLPDEQDSFEDMVNVNKWISAMFQLDQFLRSQTKYAPETMSEDTYNAFEEARTQLHNLMNENGLTFR